MSLRHTVSLRQGSLATRLRFCGLIAIAALSACTESHDVDETPSGSEEGGSGGSRSQSGTGGGGRGGSGNSSGGRGGSGNLSAGGSAGMAAPVECGGTPCAANAFLPACCTSDGKCGLSLAGLGVGEGCSEMNAAGTADTACPGQNLGGFLQLEGCCRPDGTCGVLDTFAGLGCASLGAEMATRCSP
jgi:hypothetical protein